MQALYKLARQNNLSTCVMVFGSDSIKVVTPTTPQDMVKVHLLTTELCINPRMCRFNKIISDLIGLWPGKSNLPAGIQNGLEGINFRLLTHYLFTCYQYHRQNFSLNHKNSCSMA